MRVESYTEVCRFLFGEHFLKGVHESHDGTGVQSFGVDPRVFDKGVIRPINQCVGI
jgi:hypothetical protein